MGWEKIVDIFSWLKDKLPIPDRLEAIKNRINKLERERKELIRGVCDEKKSNRIVAIDGLLADLRERLQNSTNAS